MSAAGAEVEFDAPIADLLVQRGRAKEVLAQAPVPATLKVDPKALKRALRKSKRGKR